MRWVSARSQTFFEGEGPQRRPIRFGDLKMPRRCGLEVLAWIRRQPTMEVLPVVVLTSSEQEEDKRQALALGVNAYFLKPLELEPLVETMQQIYSQWLVPALQAKR